MAAGGVVIARSSGAPIDVWNALPSWLLVVQLLMMPCEHTEVGLGIAARLDYQVGERQARNSHRDPQWRVFKFLPRSFKERFQALFRGSMFICELPSDPAAGASLVEQKRKVVEDGDGGGGSGSE